MPPSLAVVIAAYNASATIGDAVQSAFDAGAATVIVVDDGSTDATSSRARDSGAQVIRQSNAGAAAARRVGFAAVTDDFVTFLDADDELVADGVRHSLTMIERADRPVIVGGVTLGVSPSGGERRLASWGQLISFTDLIERTVGPGPPSMFIWPRSVLTKALSDDPPGLWPRFAEDYELLIRGSRHADIRLHGADTVRYAMAGGKSTLNPLNSLKDADRIRVHYGRSSGMDVRPMRARELRARAALRISWIAAADGRTWARWVGALQAVILDPKYVLGLLRGKLRSTIRRSNGREMSDL